jgi:hypothetical protein
MYSYEPVGDGWRTAAAAPQRPPYRELPGMDFPGL